MPCPGCESFCDGRGICPTARDLHTADVDGLINLVDGYAVVSVIDDLSIVYR